MNRKRWKKIFTITFGILTVFAVFIISVCIFFGIKTKSDVIGYISMIQDDFHPIWKDLAMHRIKKGDDIETVLNKYNPVLTEEFPPYTNLSFEVPFKSLVITAKNGKLIHASAGFCGWHHTFFDTPEEKERFDIAYTAYMKQALFESKAYRLHLAVVNGQDVFTSRQIERTNVPISELSEKYNIPSDNLTEEELTVQINNVLYGNLETGMVLTFPGFECSESDLLESETIFLHTDDSRILYPNTSGYQLYTTVPKKALDWYQSLTEEQKTELVARVLSRKVNFN